jgi:hypothetical protein
MASMRSTPCCVARRSRARKRRSSRLQIADGEREPRSSAKPAMSRKATETDGMFTAVTCSVRIIAEATLGVREVALDGELGV